MCDKKEDDLTQNEVDLTKNKVSEMVTGKYVDYQNWHPQRDSR